MSASGCTPLKEEWVRNGLALVHTSIGALGAQQERGVRKLSSRSSKITCEA
jgi:hypothetical protein